MVTVGNFDGVHRGHQAMLGAVSARARELGAASVVKGDLVADFTPYQVRSFAVTLGSAPTTTAAPKFQSVTLASHVSSATRPESSR